MVRLPAERGGAAALDDLVEGQGVGERAEGLAGLLERDRARGAALAGGLAGGGGDLGDQDGVTVDGVDDAAGAPLDHPAVEAGQVLDVNHRHAVAAVADDLRGAFLPGRFEIGAQQAAAPAPDEAASTSRSYSTRQVTRAAGRSVGASSKAGVSPVAPRTQIPEV